MQTKKLKRYVQSAQRLADKLAYQKQLSELRIAEAKAKAEARIEAEKAKTEEMRVRSEVLVQRWSAPKSPKVVLKMSRRQYETMKGEGKSKEADELIAMVIKEAQKNKDKQIEYGEIIEEGETEK